METITRRPVRTRSRLWAITSASSLVRHGITPNQVSLSSMVFAALGALALTSLHWAPPFMSLATPVALCVAAVCIQLRLAANLLDGLMAVEYGQSSKCGEIFNEVPDRVSDVLIIAAVGYTLGGRFIELSLFTCMLAVATAYLRAFGASLTGTQDFCGPMAKQHRMATLTAGCILSAIQYLVSGGTSISMLAVALVVVAVGSLWTCLRRLARLKEHLEN